MSSRPASSLSRESQTRRIGREMLGRRGTAWLDSSQRKGDWGVQSLLGVDPVGEIVLSTSGTTVVKNGERLRTFDSTAFFSTIDAIYTGGGVTAIGYISYDAGLPWIGVNSQHKSQFPHAHFLLYDDLQLGDGGNSSVLQVVTRQVPGSAVREWIEPQSYREGVLRLKEHIIEGDIYQANYTCRFDVLSAEDPEDVYVRLRDVNPGPYGAYINFGDYQVLSSSPERCFLLSEGRVYASPVKGTIARNSDAATDVLEKRLMSSTKDRAELLMITDLLRNDLGKTAAVGSVKVKTLYRTDVCSSVIHLVSDIEAELREGAQLSDLIMAVLPAGSITGAPKKRAVEIIDGMEACSRGVYTGCIGYISKGRADFNVAIRTMVHRDGVYQIHAGGGIVADSDPEAEYREMRYKAANLFRATGVSEWADVDRLEQR